MSIFFTDIYKPAIGLFDDPKITDAFNTSPISFFKIMYTYLQNAIPRFTNPMIMKKLLSATTLPDGQVEIIDGNGTNSYTVTVSPLINSYFEYTIDGKLVEGNYDSTLQIITFKDIVNTGSTISFEWYFPGKFTNDIDYTAQNILARLLVLCWTEKEKNFLLDIRRLLGDTDFKLPSEANSIRAKGEWYNDMKSEINKKMMKYSWDLQIQDRFKL